MKLPKFTGFDHCSTPPEVYAALNHEFNFDFDPCPLHGENIFDGLTCEWGNSNYVNPPYSNPKPWVARALFEWLGTKRQSVLLLKADTSTKMFHEWILPHAREIRFLKGRLHFPPYNKPAPFASMIVVFGE